MGSIFSQALLERIRAANDIVEIVSAVVPLKRAGANFVGLCPFHKEKTPSFSVAPQKQIFYCFGCHKGGDVFKFLELYENLRFPEAVKRLADRGKIPLEWEKGSGKQDLTKDQLLQIHEQIAQRWQSALLNDAGGEIARQYLAKRKIDSEAVRLFRLGYAPDAWDDTVNWAKSKGHELAFVAQAGLIIPREGGSGFYDRFRGRLIFPICDEQGRVVAFSGRVLTGDEKIAKYVNSPETPIFTKGRIFFGLDKSKRAIADAGYAIICEGQLDLIRCYLSGVKNIVAPQGTAFTSDHARILKRYADEVVLCFDSDSAGQSAAVRALDPLLAAGLSVRVAVVPRPHDPDSFVREEGPDAFRRLVEGALGFFDFYLERLGQIHDVQTDKGRVALLHAMAEALRKTNNMVLLDTYAQKTALRLGVSAEAVRTEFKKTAAALANRRGPDDKPEPLPERVQVKPMELWLLKLVFFHQDLIPWIREQLQTGWIEHPAVRKILELRFAAHESGTWSGPAALLQQLESIEDQQLLTASLVEERAVSNANVQARDIVQRLRNQAIDRRLAEMVRQAAAPGISDGDRLMLLQSQQELRQQKGVALSPPPGG